MFSFTENVCSRATKFVSVGPVGDVVAVGSTCRTVTVVVAALVSESMLLRTMNWLPNTRRVEPLALFDTLVIVTSCVARPDTVFVSTRAKVRPAACEIGA
jgi:hypothetical protein